MAVKTSSCKNKTHRGAAKRFKKTGNGLYKRRKSNRSHILTHKSTKRKLHLRTDAYVKSADVSAVKELLGEK